MASLAILFRVLLLSLIVYKSVTGDPNGSGESENDILTNLAKEIEALKSQINDLSAQLNRSMEVNDKQSKLIESLQKSLNKSGSSIKIPSPSSLSPVQSSSLVSKAQEPSDTSTNILSTSTSIQSSAKQEIELSASPSSIVKSSQISNSPTISPILTTPSDLPKVTPPITIITDDNDDEVQNNSNTLMGVVIAVFTLLIIGSIVYVIYQYRLQIRDWIMSKEEQIQETLQNGSNFGGRGRHSSGNHGNKRYNLLPQHSHDISLHND